MNSRFLHRIALVMSFGGAMLSASVVSAQPGTMVAPVTSSLTAQDKSKFERLMLSAEKQRLFETLLSLHIQDGSLPQIIAEIEKAIPAAAPIEVRDDTKVKLSFDVKEKSLGDVLNALATLSQSKCSFLPQRIVIAPLDDLSLEERATRIAVESSTSSVSPVVFSQSAKFTTPSVVMKNNSTHEAQKFAIELLKQLAAEKKFSDVPFGGFSSDYQRLIQFVVSNMAEGRKVAIPPDTRVSLNTSAEGQFSMVVQFTSLKRQIRLNVAPDVSPTPPFLPPFNANSAG